MIAAADTREQTRAYGRGMATGHAGMDTEGTAEDKSFRTEAAESTRRKRLGWVTRQGVSAWE